MPVDSSIALGIRTPQFADPMAQYANVLAIQNAGNQNALSQYTLARAKREDEDTNALRRELAGVGSMDSPEGLRAAQNALMRVGRVKEAQELGKSALDARNVRSQIGERDLNAGIKAMGQYRDVLGEVTNPQIAAQWLQAQYNDPLVGPVVSRMRPLSAAIAAIPNDPQGFQQWVQKSALGMDKFITENKPQLSTRDMGGTVQDRTFQPLTGTLNTLGTTAKTATIGEQETARHNPIMEGIARGNLGVAQGNLGVAQGNLGVSEQRLLDSRNPTLQGTLSSAKAEGGAMGKARAEMAIDPIVAASGAKKILSAVNYDEKTGADDISKLIKKSTSGILQNTLAQSYGAVRGVATSGREAIGQLTTEANKLTLDLMGGKLGSGISNADRDFVLGQLGDVSNANTPANERLAAWNRALGRLKSIAATSGQASKPIGNPYANKTDAEIRKELGL